MLSQYIELYLNLFILIVSIFQKFLEEPERKTKEHQKYLRLDRERKHHNLCYDRRKYSSAKLPRFRGFAVQRLHTYRMCSMCAVYRAVAGNTIGLLADIVIFCGPDVRAWRTSPLPLQRCSALLHLNTFRVHVCVVYVFTNCCQIHFYLVAAITAAIPSRALRQTREIQP